MLDIVKCDRSHLVDIGSSLIGLYQEVFAEPPECQVWLESELIAIFNQYVAEGHLFLAEANSKVIGFCAAIPLTASKIWHSGASDGFIKYTLDAETLYFKFGIDALHSWYIPDLGVASSHRKRGVATQLMQVAMQAGAPILIRVSLCRKGAIALYKKLGFKPMGLFQTAGYKQCDGSVKVFEKMLMILS
ncbi:MAG TPA: GNAT family N-acetyltransferase [Candidatus Obscuribacterales bacterium]